MNEYCLFREIARLERYGIERMKWVRSAPHHPTPTRLARRNAPAPWACMENLLTKNGQEITKMYLKYLELLATLFMFLQYVVLHVLDFITGPEYLNV